MATAGKANKSNAADPKWGKNANGQFHRLTFVEPDKEGIYEVAGIFAAWHAGVKPRWIAVDKSRGLGASITALAKDEDIRQYQVHGGVYATWALIRDEHQDGVLRFLLAAMKPIIEPAVQPAEKTKLIPVILPRA